MYNSDEEVMETVEKRANSFLQHTKSGLRGQKRSPTPGIKADSPDLQNTRFASVSPVFNVMTGLKDLRDRRSTPGSQQGTNKYYPNIPDFYRDVSK